VRESAVTATGKLMTERLDAARERLERTVSSWSDDDVEELVRLTSKLADAMNEAPANAAARPTRKLDRK
jgi:predicted lipid-binding transport protein (Tim44 family)